jgi:hypothetical protein
MPGIDSPGLFESRYHITPFTAEGGGGLQVSRPRFETSPGVRRMWQELLQSEFRASMLPRHDDVVDVHTFSGSRPSLVIIDDVIPETLTHEQMNTVRDLVGAHPRLARTSFRLRGEAIESLTLSAEELRTLAAKTPAQLKSWAVDMAARATREQPF